MAEGIAGIGDQLAALATPQPTVPVIPNNQPTGGMPAFGSQPQNAFGPRPVEILTGIELSNFLNVGIFGPEGAGKTLLAASAPSPLFLDTENSSAALRDWPGLLPMVKVARRVRWAHAEQLLTRLADPKDDWADRETVVLDTLDAFQASNLEAILKGGKTDEFLPMEHHYKKSGEMLRRWLTDLRDLDNRHLIVLCHEKEIFVEGTGQRFVRPATTPKVMDVLWRDFDVVGHLRSLRVDWEKDPWENGLQTVSDAVIRAKSRLRYLPPQIRNPTFNDLLEAFNKYKEQTK